MGIIVIRLHWLLYSQTQVIAGNEVYPPSLQTVQKPVCKQTKDLHLPTSFSTIDNSPHYWCCCVEARDGLVCSSFTSRHFEWFFLETFIRIDSSSFFLFFLQIPRFFTAGLWWKFPLHMFAFSARLFSHVRSENGGEIHGGIQWWIKMDAPGGGGDSRK